MTEFLLSSVENTKKGVLFDILMAILRVNVVNRQMAPFFSSALQELQNSILWRPSFTLCSGL